MPDLGITRPQAEDILAHIAAESGGAAGAPGGPAPQVSLPPGNADAGHALFVGERHFAKGPACIACHNVGGTGTLEGGTWAKDLSGVVGRLGPQGIASILKAPPFPPMDVAYGANTFSDQEIADLIAYLDTAPPTGGPPQSSYFVLISGFMVAVLAVAASLIWRGRARGPREPIIRR